MNQTFAMMETKTEAWSWSVPLIQENAPTTDFDKIGGLFITRFNRPSAQETSTNASTLPPETTPNTAQETLLQHLRNHPVITTAELAQATGLSPDGVKYHLNRLKRTGQLRRHGPTKGGYWEVITRGDE